MSRARATSAAPDRARESAAAARTPSPAAAAPAASPPQPVLEPSRVDPAVALGAFPAVAADAAAAGLVHGAGDAEHPFHVDPVPRVIEADDWQRLARGIEQRVRALEAFAADAHGAQTAVRAGVVPPDVLASSRYLESGVPAPKRWIGLAGPDVVRGADGSFVVLEDNVRTPTMLGFALALRRLVRRHVPGGPEPVDALVRAALLGMLRSATDVEDPVIAVLGDGRRSALRWELAATAKLLDVPLLEPHEVRGVDVLWRRTS